MKGVWELFEWAYIWRREKGKEKTSKWIGYQDEEKWRWRVKFLKHFLSCSFFFWGKKNSNLKKKKDFDFFFRDLLSSCRWQCCHSRFWISIQNPSQHPHILHDQKCNTISPHPNLLGAFVVVIPYSNGFQLLFVPFTHAFDWVTMSPHSICAFIFPTEAFRIPSGESNIH